MVDAMNSSVCIIHVALLCWLGGAQGQGVSSADGGQVVGAVRAETGVPCVSVEEVVKRLGAVDWRQREAATSELMSMDLGCLPILKNAFVQTRSYEVRRRMKRVIREIYMVDILGAPRAFLGITSKVLVGGGGVDARVLPGTSAVYVRDIVDGGPADRAGLKRHDIILMLDGKWCLGESQATGILDWIGEQSPGQGCRLGVLRGCDGIVLHRLTAGFRPAELGKIEFREVTNAEDPRIPPDRAGILVENVERIDRRLRIWMLRPDDVILALDGKPIPPADPAAYFLAWTESEEEAVVSEEAPEVGLLSDYGVGMTSRTKATAHILRGGRWIELAVVLGRAPEEARLLKKGAKWRCEGATVDHAHAQFETWWESTFDVDSILVTGSRTEAWWRLDARGTGD